MANVPQFGFVDIEFLFDRPAQDVSTAVINEAIDRTLAYYNRKVGEYTSNLVTTTKLVKERFLGPVGAGSLQGLDEDGNPYPTAPYEGYDVGYPVYGAGDAYGTNRLSRAAMTVEDINNKLKDVQIKDKKFLLNNILAALLTSTQRTFLDRTRLGYVGSGDLTVMPLANNDAITYLVNESSNVTQNHYLGQTASIDNANNPFPTIYSELSHHLINDDPEIDVYVADNLVTSIKALGGFLQVVDPATTPGSGITVLNKNIPTGIGDRAIGYVDRCNIISMRKLPNSYMLAVARGSKPLAMREYPFSGWQGLFKEDFNVDGNHQEVRFLRFCGFGVRDRTAALAYQIGSATYTTPTNFTAPMAVA